MGNESATAQLQLEGQCAICDDRFRVTKRGRLHRHNRRGGPCEGLNWPPIAQACLLPRTGAAKLNSEQ